MPANSEGSGETVWMHRLAEPLLSVYVISTPFTWIGSYVDIHISTGLSFRPELFYYLVLGRFLTKPRLGGGNKNKMTKTCMSGI